MKKIFLFSILFFLAGCSSLLYYPRRDLIYLPNHFNLTAEDVEFQSADGNKISAWWFPAKQTPSKGTIVFFHGNAENISSHFIQMGWLPEAGYSFLIFDYPGYGKSEGEPTPKNTVQAGMAAIQWVYKNKDQRPLVIYGQSLGGIVAMRTMLDVRDSHASKGVPIKAMVVDSSFASYKKVAQKVLSKSWITWPFQWMSYLVLSDEWAPEVERISPTPLLVIHGQQDRIVPFEMSENIFQQASEPKEFWKIPDGNHIQTYFIDHQSYRKKLLEYLER